MSHLRIRYQTVVVGEVDIHLCTLWDTQQVPDQHPQETAMGISSASWALFGVLWDSGRVLAHLMLDHEVAGLRVLEVGCGVGLASLVLHGRHADVTATDRHPAAGPQLARNVALNNGAPLPFVRADWEDVHDDALGNFDLIIGSDVLYERDHVDQLARFVDRHASPRCEVVVVDAGRGLHPRFTRQLEVLGFSVHHDLPDDLHGVAGFQGRILGYRR